MTLQAFSESFPILAVERLLASDGTTQRNIFTPDQIPLLRIDSILVANQDAIDHLVIVGIANQDDLNILGSAVIPARTGWDGSKSIDLLAAVLPTTVTGLVNPINVAWWVQTTVAVTGANRLSFIMIGGQL